MSACFDEGILQAYADGELQPARAGEVAAHLETCAACASAVDEAAQHFALLSSALGANETINIPTERLRARIDAAIAELQPVSAAQYDAPTSQAHASPSFVERLRAFASSLVAAPRRATAFASLLVAAVLLAAIFFVLRPQSRGPQVDQSGKGEIAKVNQPSSTAGSATREGGANDVTTGGEEIKQASGAGGSEQSEGPGVNEPGVDLPATGRRTRRPVGSAGFTNAGYTREGGARGGASRSNNGAGVGAMLPVEQPYASAVASLKSSIDQQAARVMTPTLRAEYERNLAVVDRAIDASRAAARRDPADKDAQEFLRSAYEDKLELLRTVSDQTQIASIGRQ